MTVNLSETTSTSELYNELSVRIYDPTFSDVRDNLSKVPEALRNIILFVDFDTEVIMGGILTFLENSSGAYLSETVEMFQAIGATENAHHLANIRNIMQSFGVTHESLRQDFDAFEEYEITTFEKTHGTEIVSFAEAVQTAARALYLYDGNEENPYELLELYVEQNREEIIAAFNESVNFELSRV